MISLYVILNYISGGLGMSDSAGNSFPRWAHHGKVESPKPPKVPKNDGAPIAKGHIIHGKVAISALLLMGNYLQ
jgi:hypothetical protein